MKIGWLCALVIAMLSIAGCARKSDGVLLTKKDFLETTKKQHEATVQSIKNVKAEATATKNEVSRLAGDFTALADRVNDLEDTQGKSFRQLAGLEAGEQKSLAEGVRRRDVDLAITVANEIERRRAAGSAAATTVGSESASATTPPAGSGLTAEERETLQRLKEQLDAAAAEKARIEQDLRDQANVRLGVEQALGGFGDTVTTGLTGLCEKMDGLAVKVDDLKALVAKADAEKVAFLMELEAQMRKRDGKVKVLADPDRIPPAIVPQLLRRQEIREYNTFNLYLDDHPARRTMYVYPQRKIYPSYCR
ncbi:MAG: hypothetical protein WEA04_03275 [Candidatus Andersenbacteria bacterium]